MNLAIVRVRLQKGQVRPWIQDVTQMKSRPFQNLHKACWNTVAYKLGYQKWTEGGNP